MHFYFVFSIILIFNKASVENRVKKLTAFSMHRAICFQRRQQKTGQFQATAINFVLTLMFKFIELVALLLLLEFANGNDGFYWNFVDFEMDAHKFGCCFGLSKMPESTNLTRQMPGVPCLSLLLKTFISSFFTTDLISGQKNREEDLQRYGWS